ncbi:MAG TPA: hypothetical protein VG938_15275 [Verrucomicrobiae bacterium]|jgi:hypothetical protein|nr:hypothetical protein [Verrucomicrobiae bacterium]
MARALNWEEAALFEDAISPERKFALECGGSLESLTERRDEELELTPESAFWFGVHFPGATNS